MRRRLLILPLALALLLLVLATACGEEGKAEPTPTATVEARATDTPAPLPTGTPLSPTPTDTPLPPKPADTPIPPEPTDTPVLPPPSQQQEQPAAPPPVPPLPGPTTYTGTHSGGGTVSFVVTADGRSVEFFLAKGFCGFDGEYLGVPSMRIQVGGSFYWEGHYYGRLRVVSGSLGAPGHASGYVSYHWASCHQDYLSWTASAE